MNIADGIAEAKHENLVKLRTSVRDQAIELVDHICSTKGETFRSGIECKIKELESRRVIWLLPDSSLLPREYVVTDAGEILVTKLIREGWFFSRERWSAYAVVDIDMLDETACEEMLRRFERMRSQE